MAADIEEVGECVKIDGGKVSRFVTVHSEDLVTKGFILHGFVDAVLNVLKDEATLLQDPRDEVKLGKDRFIMALTDSRFYVKLITEGNDILNHWADRVLFNNYIRHAIREREYNTYYEETMRGDYDEAFEAVDKRNADRTKANDMMYL